MYLSPSIYCGIGSRPVTPIVKRAQQVSSWGLDWFNPGSRQLIKLSPGNMISKLLPTIETGNAHGWTPRDPKARSALITEIERAIG
jgi:hypothetical protein